MDSADGIAKEISDRNAIRMFQQHFGHHVKDMNAFLEQLLTHVFYREEVSDYFGAMMYASLASYVGSLLKIDRKVLDSLRTLIDKNKTKYKESLSVGTNQKTNEKTVQFEPLRTLYDDFGNVLSFDSLAGMTNEKEKLKHRFIYPLLYESLYLKKNNNVLLYGPPGTGKTQITKALVSELNRIQTKIVFHFFAAEPDKLRDKWEGGTEKNIAALFEQAETYSVQQEASDGSIHRSVIFIDEMEGLAGERTDTDSRSVTALLQQMDGTVGRPHCIVIGATNYPWRLDDAIRRRFNSFLFVDLPDIDTVIGLCFETMINRLNKYFPERICQLRLFNKIEEPFQSLCRKAWRKDADDPIERQNYKSLYEVYMMFHHKFPSIPYQQTNQTLHVFLNDREDISIEHMIDVLSNEFNDAELIAMKDKKVSISSFCQEKSSVKEVLQFAFILALKTSPCQDTARFLLDNKYTMRKFTCGSNVSVSSFGYSVSDITKVLNEYFIALSADIIDHGYVRNEDVKQKLVYHLPQQGAMITSFYEQSSSMNAIKFDDVYKNPTFAAVTKKENKYYDLYALLDVQKLFYALNEYKSIVGFKPDYVDFYQFQAFNTIEKGFELHHTFTKQRGTSKDTSSDTNASPESP